VLGPARGGRRDGKPARVAAQIQNGSICAICVE
jgi:hypothetical protein